MKESVVIFYVQKENIRKTMWVFAEKKLIHDDKVLVTVTVYNATVNDNVAASGDYGLNAAAQRRNTCLFEWNSAISFIIIHLIFSNQGGGKKISQYDSVIIYLST